MTRFDLAALLQAAGDAAKAGFEEKGLSFKIEATPPVPFNGDSETMSDLLVELIDNARKFTRSWATISVSQENGRVTIAASNDTTLPAGGADQVFDRFTRLDNAANTPGVGLGLAHVKDIVKAHNGRVSARVADGVFTLRVSL